MAGVVAGEEEGRGEPRPGLAALGDLLQELARVLRSCEATEARIIDLELAILLQARGAFLQWVTGEGGAEPPLAEGANPAQFLRAWNDSAGRAVQLLRARRALGAGHAEELDRLLDDVLRDLETLPGLAAPPEVAPAGEAPVEADSAREPSAHTPEAAQ